MLYIYTHKCLYIYYSLLKDFFKECEKWINYFPTKIGIFMPKPK